MVRLARCISRERSEKRSDFADKQRSLERITMTARVSASDDDTNDIYLSHEFRLALTKPAQSSFRVLALLFYKAEEETSKFRLPPWIRHEINGDGDNTKRTYVVGTNDEPGNVVGAICAERSAMVQLRFLPSCKVTKLVIATDATEPIACGMLCREFLAGHTSVPWNLKIISTACQCERCGLKDEALFQKKESCVGGHAKHSIPTLSTTLKQLYPYPSPFTRLTAKESVTLGEKYSGSSKSLRDLEGLHETAKRLMEIAIVEAKSNVSHNHPIQFGAAAILENETIVTSHQSCALEYGCTLDAVSQLAPYLKENASAPVLLVQTDQFGIAHAPFAPARAFLSENGFETCLVLLHDTPNLDSAAEDLYQWRLKEIPVAALAPNAPDWKINLKNEKDLIKNNQVHEGQRRKPPSRESSHDNLFLESSFKIDEGQNSFTSTGEISSTIEYAPLDPDDASISSSLHKEKLKIVSQDLVNKFNESKGSFSSELSLFVNDSARGVSFEEVYEKHDVLGEGGFAFVYRCVHKERQTIYAVKEVFSENYETPGQSMKEEISSLKRLKDIPYIVRLLDVFRGAESTHLVMEEMKGGDLLDKLYEKEVFSEEESKRISRRLLEAIFFCHKKGIAHRDIKPENIVSSLQCSGDRDSCKVVANVIPLSIFLTLSIIPVTY
jgi:cytidine deaminase